MPNGTYIHKVAVRSEALQEWFSKRNYIEQKIDEYVRFTAEHDVAGKAKVYYFPRYYAWSYKALNPEVGWDGNVISCITQEMEWRYGRRRR